MNNEKLNSSKILEIWICHGELHFISICKIKSIGPHTRLEENCHLPVSRRPVLQETCSVLNMHVLVHMEVMQEIMCSKDAQCNSEELS